jgi:peptidoglycan hydrolase-like protein with peptidoglycan-binding domain
MTISAVSSGSRSSGGGSVLALGSRGPAVADLQRKLAAAGFSPGAADGVFGPHTQAAVRAFQAARHLQVDGIAGPQTMGALGSGGAVSGGGGGGPVSSGGGQPTLRQGSSGPAVADLQRKLAGAGFNPGGVDGVFGPNTRNAVIRFQSAHHLGVDGVVGPQTWGALGGSSFTTGGGGGVNNPPPPSNGSLRSNILNVAAGQIGNVEATNNNDGAVTKYPGYFGRGPESYCADFVSWVLSHSGEPKNYFNTETMRHEWSAEGKWKGRNNPQPGDLVWFDWNGDGVTDHIGFVKSVNANGTITTIEGNTGGPNGREGVWEKTRTWDTIAGFASP